MPLLGGSFISQFEKEGLISTLLSRRQADLTKALSSSNKCAKSGRWYRIIRARLLFARSLTLAFALPSIILVKGVFSSFERKKLSGGVLVTRKS